MDKVENLDRFVEGITEHPYFDYEAPLERDGWVIRWVGLAVREVEAGENRWLREPTSRMEVQGRLAFSKHLAREEDNEDLLRATAQELIALAEEDQENQERYAQRFEADALMALEVAAGDYADTGRITPYLDNLIRYALRTLGIERTEVIDALERPLRSAEKGYLARLKGPQWLVDKATSWVDEATAVISDPIRGRMITIGDDELLSADLLEAGRRGRERSVDAQLLRDQVALIAEATAKRDELILKCLRRGFTQKEVAEFSSLSQPRISLMLRETGGGYTAPSRA